MAVIYGIQTTTLKDLLANTGRPKNIVSFVEANYKYIIDKALGCFLRQDAPQSMGPKPVEFIFIPLDIVEEIIINSNLREALNKAYNEVITKEKIDKIINLVDIADERIEDLVFSYSQDINKILDMTCVLAVKNTKDNSIMDVCITTPDRVISKMHKHIDYVCCKCGHTETIDGYTEFFPYNTKYEVINNEVVYYCLECAEQYGINTFVGDSISG